MSFFGPIQFKSQKLRCGGISKFIVIKGEDINAALSQSQMRELGNILDSIDKQRRSIGKKIDNEYLVINTDEPYAPEIIEIMKSNGHWG